ncbi:AMP-binding protein, partial [Kribbia dieselivorans]|uniref:AMP-binding protein n=1 Tax=Kribbia dieselivorans TaxID=331526 RepID=UPI0008384D37
PHADDAPPPDLPAPADRPEGLALVVGTSGSTGAPKLAMLTADAIIASDDATHVRFGGPGQWLLAMPARHIAGLQVLFRSLRAGTTPIALDHRQHFDAPLFADAAGRLTAARRYVSLTPTQVTRVLADPRGVDALRSFDRVLIGGAAVPAPLLERVRAAGAHPVTSYGMSETAGGAVYDGRPLDGSAVRIVEGRVHVGGPTLARGYLGLPERSAQVFIADADGARWFVTDDAGHLDDEGLLQIDGRLDDLINTGGLKVLPRLVEEALLRHLP